MWQVKINKSIIIGAYHLGMCRFFMLFCLAFKERYLLLLSYRHKNKTAEKSAVFINSMRDNYYDFILP